VTIAFGERLKMGIICVERVIVGVADLAVSRENWCRAGFAVASDQFDADGIRFARLAAGAVEIDLCTITSVDTQSMLAAHVREAATNEGAGAIIGWVWGEKGAKVAYQSHSIAMPGLSETSTTASMLTSGLPGVVTAVAPITLDIESRRQWLTKICGTNSTLSNISSISS
jgi:hypothetical protein